MWGTWDAPGLTRGAEQLIGKPARTILDWRYGRYPPTQFALDRVREELLRRGNEMLALAEEIKKEKGR